MATKGGSKMFWIIGGLIVVAGSVGAYFLLRKPKDENKGEGDTDTDTDTDIKSDDGNKGGGNVGGGSATYTAPSDLNDSTKIKAFQDWLDANKPCWLLDSSDGKYKNLSKNAGACNKNAGGTGYGSYGKNTDTAWKIFGTEYISKKGTAPASTTDKEKVDSADIETIIKNATGLKAERTYLQKAKSDFVSSWAKAIRNKESAFIWANQVYRTATGEKVLEYNPIGVKHYAKITGKIAKLRADDSADASSVDKGTDLGKVEGVRYDKGVWLYAPNESYLYKWYKSDYVTKTKTSSFMGSDMDLDMFASFDNNLDLNL